MVEKALKDYIKKFTGRRITASLFLEMILSANDLYKKGFSAKSVTSEVYDFEEELFLRELRKPQNKKSWLQSKIEKFEKWLGRKK